MNTRFDDAVQASWGQFEKRMSDALAGIREGSFTVNLEGETDEGGALPYVQFAGYGDMIRAEVSGNEFLVPAYRIGIAQESALLALGWRQPTDVESPNWYFDVPRDQADIVLSMVTAAFYQVFGVIHPELLVSERLWPDSDAAGCDLETASDAGIKDGEDAPSVMGFPETSYELMELVTRTLAQVYGDDLIRDEDGDFPIDTGTVPIWVRVHAERPMVRILSYVVRSVRDVRQARIEISILNRRQDLLKFMLEDGVIVASYDLPALPFFGSQLLWTLERVSEQLDDLAKDAATRVGGKLWLDEASRHAGGSEGPA